MSARDDGRAQLDRLFGQNYSANRDGQRNAFNSTLIDYIEEVNFGSLWQRPGMNVKQRVELTIGILVATNRLPQAKAYMRAAGTVGLTRDDLREILMHIAVYAGLPAAEAGFDIATEVFAAEDAQPGQTG